MRKFNQQKEQEILLMYREGKTQKEIAEYFGTFNTSIRRVLFRNNIIPKGNDIQQRLCKHNPFKRGDEYSDYFLGLLLTDGNIDSRGRIRLALNSKDESLIEQFRNWASPKSKITKTLQKLNNSYMSAVSFTNKEALEYITRKGNFVNKSFEAKLYIPMNYHILRGILDGDGGFYRQNKHGLNVQICGKSKVLISQVFNFLKREGYSPIKRVDARGLITVSLHKQAEVLRFGKQVYTCTHIFMQRKYDRWLSFYENRSKKHTLNSGN